MLCARKHKVSGGAYDLLEAITAVADHAVALADGCVLPMVFFLGLRLLVLKGGNGIGPVLKGGGVQQEGCSVLGRPIIFFGGETYTTTVLVPCSCIINTSLRVENCQKTVRPGGFEPLTECYLLTGYFRAHQ